MSHRRDALDAIGAGFGLQASVLISGVLAARLLGPEDRGLLALMWIVALVLAQLGTLGIPTAVPVFLGRERTAGRAIAATCVRVGAKQALAVLLIQVAVLTWVFSGPRAEAREAALATLPVPIAMITQLYGLAILQGLGRLRAMQLLRLLPVASYAALLLGGFLFGHPTLAFAAVAWTTAYVGSAIVTLEVVRSSLRGIPHMSRRDSIPSRALQRFGLRAMVGAVSPVETFRVDQLLVGLVLSAHALGLYVAALAFTNLPRFVAQGIGQVAVVRIASLREVDSVPLTIRRYTALATVAALCIAVPLAALAEPLMVFFFGAPFEAAVPAMQILQVATVLVCTRRVLGDCLRGAQFPAASSVAELVSYVVLVPCLVIGVAWNGAEGVAWALVASSAVSLAVLLRFAARRIHDFDETAPVTPASWVLADGVGTQIQSGR